MTASLVEAGRRRPASARLQGRAAPADNQSMDSEYFAGPAPHPAFVSVAADGAPDGAADGTAPPQGPPPANPVRPGRFAKTEVSFGLTGRVVLTILLLIPLAGFIYLATHYFIGIGGIVVYGGVVVPWALRDLWRHPSHR